MVNNIGTISTTLPRTVGSMINVMNGSTITAVSGYVDIGFIVFDNNGTMAICTSFTRDADDNPIYAFRTCTLNTAIDTKQMLTANY